MRTRSTRADLRYLCADPKLLQRCEIILSKSAHLVLQDIAINVD